MRLRAASNAYVSLLPKCLEPITSRAFEKCPQRDRQTDRQSGVPGAMVPFDWIPGFSLSLWGRGEDFHFGDRHMAFSWEPGLLTLSPHPSPLPSPLLPPAPLLLRAGLGQGSSSNEPSSGSATGYWNLPVNSGAHPRSHAQQPRMTQPHLPSSTPATRRDPGAAPRGKSQDPLSTLLVYPMCLQGMLGCSALTSPAWAPLVSSPEGEPPAGTGWARTAGTSRRIVCNGSSCDRGVTTSRIKLARGGKNAPPPCSC